MGVRKKRLIALLISVLAVCVVVEVWLRMRLRDNSAPSKKHVHVRSSNPRLIYEQRPNHEVHFPGKPIVVRTNSAGFRDDEFVMPKPEGVFRIAVVGDSVTVGWHVQLEHTYPQLMEGMFREAGERVDVMNLGVSGYNSIQEVETLRAKGLAFAPDLAIVGYVLNDHLVKGQGTSANFTRGFSRLLDRVKVGVRRLARIVGESVAEEAFGELAAITRKVGIPVLVVIFPRMDDDAEYPHQARHDEITELCGKHGFGVLNLLSAFRKVGFKNVRLGEDNLHPNERGHRLAAREIFAYLRAHPQKRDGD